MAVVSDGVGSWVSLVIRLLRWRHNLLTWSSITRACGRETRWWRWKRLHTVTPWLRVVTHGTGHHAAKKMFFITRTCAITLSLHRRTKSNACVNIKGEATTPPPRSTSDHPGLWRARDDNTRSSPDRRHTQRDLNSGRRAGKDAARRRLDQDDEPDAQRTSRGGYLRVRHKTDKQAHERESVRLNRTPQQWRTRACQILPPPRSLAPLDLRNGGPLRWLKATPFSLRSPRPSDPAPRRGLALTGVPAPKHVPCSTSTSALHRARPVCGHGAKGRGLAATA